MGSVLQKEKKKKKEDCRSYFILMARYNSWVHSCLPHYRWRQSWNHSQLSQSSVFMLNACSSIFPLSPSPAWSGLLFHLFCSWGVIPQVLKSRHGLNWCSSESLQRWFPSITTGSLQGAAGSEIANLLPLCFANSCAVPQPGLTCIGKGCLHTKGLNCFGCLQMSILRWGLSFDSMLAILRAWLSRIMWK